MWRLRWVFDLTLIGYVLLTVKMRFGIIWDEVW